jgi:HK97 gp10 family phage protein
MSSNQSNGLDRTLAAMDRVKRAPREMITKALLTTANEVASAQRHLAESSRDTGALIDSITVTPPGHSTPPYSQPGGSRVAGELEVIITAGNSDVRYAHLVEYGTAKSEAKPFFWLALRLLRKRAENRINRAARKAVKDAWNAK